MPLLVFINYRRSDSEGQTRSIRQALQQHLGEDAVFMDVDSIPPGAPWPERIKTALMSAETIVAVIGRRWLQAKDAWERRRIDQEEDWVRLELETAFAMGKKIIPVYVEGATPLPKAALPSSIQKLSENECISLRHDHWNTDIQLLLNEFPAVAKPSPGIGAFTSSEDQKLRNEFLRQVGADVAHRLASSVHVARFIDLGIKHDSTAVGALWGYRNPDTHEEHASLLNAFEAARRRLLLLGQPGSGKTTALLHLAQALITQASADTQAPVPFFVNLSKFNRLVSTHADEKQNRHDNRFIDWLTEEMAEVPGMTEKVAHQWLDQSRVAALLDGLDEYNDDHRPELAHLINASFLHRYPSMVVVVCSRTNDYALLRGTENRLKLEDAIELQPLTPGQIREYLTAAQATGLLDAIRDDPSLNELAKTPLTLSMLALAYGGLPPDQMPKALSLTESRRHLFEAYVDRRLQYDARRRVNKPMDDHRGNDLPAQQYRYPTEKVSQWLGTLAVVLSQRMTTVFTVDRFYSLLMPDEHMQSVQVTRYRSVMFAQGLFIVLLALTAALPILPMSLEGGFWAGLLMALGLMASYGKGSENNCDGNFTPFAVFTVAGLWVMVLSNMIAPWLGNVSPSALVPLLALILFTPIAFLVACIDRTLFRLEDDNPVLFAIVPLAVAGIGTWLFTRQQLIFFPVEWVATLTATFALAVLVACFAERGEKLKNLFGPILLSGGLCSVSHFIGNPGWKLVSCSLPVLFVALHGFPSIWMLGLLFTFAAAAFGGLFWGYQGTAFAALTSVLGYVAVAIGTRNRRGYGAIGQNWGQKSHDSIYQRLVVSLWSPCVWVYWSFRGYFPWRKQAFLSFCHEIHLLKTSNQGGIEFIHRLLRDYFALQVLMPRVECLAGTARLYAIRSLGFQGESALDPLMEMAEKGDTHTRAAALEGISHIPSPVLPRFYERRLNDLDPVVRGALVTAILKLPGEEKERLIDAMVPLGDGCEAIPYLRGVDVLGRDVLYQDRQAHIFAQKWGEPGIQSLLDLMSDRQSWIHTGGMDGAIQVLVILREHRAAPLLIKALSWLTEDNRMMFYVIRALASIGDESAIEPLIVLLHRNTKYGRDVIFALSALMGTKVVSPLMNWLAGSPSPNPHIIQAVDVVLQHANEHELNQLRRLIPQLRKRLKKTPKALLELDALMAGVEK